MANNVDLMVVGATEGLSAVELTERLVAEFKQPAEAFTELVAAACGGGPKYAAQSSVTLDTAVEGQGKLEDLGVVCELLVDGEVLPSSGFSNAVTAAAPRELPEESPAEIEIFSEPVAESSADAPTASADEIALEESEQSSEDSTQATAEDIPVLDLSDDSNDADGGLPEENELDIVEVSFDDELGSLGAVASDKTEVQANDSQDSEGLESVEIDFDDELESLDGLTVSAKINEPEVVEQTATASDTAEADSSDSAALLDASEISQDAAQLSVDAVGSEQSDVAPAEVEPPASKPDEPVELSLAVDDSTPLTKPKKNSDAKPDDGGLTLVVDDEPIAKKLEDKPAFAETSAERSADDDAAAEISLETEFPNLRDTSREPVEITPPVDVPEETDEPEAPESKPDAADVVAEPKSVSLSATDNIGDLSDSLLEKTASESPDSELSAEEKGAAADNTDQIASAVINNDSSAEADDMTSFIESLAGAADSGGAGGGLVLPGQVADEVAGDTASASTEDETSEIDEIPDEIHPTELKDDDDAVYAPEVTSSGGLTDEFVRRRAKKRVAAVAASIGVIGLGAYGAWQSGLLQKSVEPTNTVAVVTPITDGNAELDAVEEVSLNAAIERTTVLKNPDKYTTEELIVYLAKDLGENAKNELKNYVSGDAEYKTTAEVPRMGAAIPADSDSELWLRNRVNHPADEFFDEWSKREVDLQAYLELQDRLIEVGDLEIALDVSNNTKDKLFAVMSQQRLARAYHDLGKSDKASEVLARAVRGTYAIELESERVLAIADYALTEQALGLKEDAEDSFLKASILSRSLHKPQNRTVAFSAIAEFFHEAQRKDDMRTFLDLAMTTAYELPVNTAARDLAIRHVALTEVRLGLTDQATEHANLIVDPFAAVSALHGIALELERTGDEENARQTLNMAYRAGSLIKNSEKREKLLEKIRLAGS